MSAKRMVSCLSDYITRINIVHEELRDRIRTLEREIEALHCVNDNLRIVSSRGREALVRIKTLAKQATTTHE